jgi:hypothetical protein
VKYWEIITERLHCFALLTARDAETHTVEITGKTESHALDIEIKK